MARIIPYAAIRFASHEQWKIVLSVDKDHRYKKNIGKYLTFARFGDSKFH